MSAPVGPFKKYGMSNKVNKGGPFAFQKNTFKMLPQKFAFIGQRNINTYFRFILFYRQTFLLKEKVVQSKLRLFWFSLVFKIKNC